MSGGAPWSVKGIDPKAREVAKDLARRSGMTLGEWLNRVILDDDVPEDVTTEAQFTERLGRAEGRHLRAVPPPAPATPDFARVAFALDRLTERIEASETRTGLAISGVEHSVRQAIARIETTEREHVASVARLEGLVAAATTEQSQAGERLRRLELDGGPRSAEALRVLEMRVARMQPDQVVDVVLERLGERLAAAEARTGAAIADLTRSMGQLDRRVNAVESVGGEAAERRFEALAQTLSQQVNAVRAEVAEALSASAGPGPNFEARFAALAERVQAAEQKSGRAVEEIGRQVLAMADAVGRKLIDVDNRSAEAIDQVGTEVARIAGAVELRLARAEQTQAESFERLGAELARVKESLDARLAGAPAPAKTELPPPPEPELEPEMSVASTPEAEAAPQLGLPDPPSAAFGPELFSRAEIAEGDTIEPPWRRLDIDVPDTEVPEVFAPLDEDDDLFELNATPAGSELSTREVIERARAAARAAQATGEQSADLGPAAAKARAADVRAQLGTKAASGRLFQGFAMKPRRAPNSAMQTALMVAGGAAFLSVGAAGLTLVQAQRPSVPEPPVQAEAPPLPANPRAAVALGPASLLNPATTAAPAAPPFPEVRADVEAGAPGALQRLKSLAEGGHAQAQLYLAQLYDSGEAGLPRNPVEARRLTALAADQGDVKAMHNLGVYLFRGEGGPADVAAAAEWFRKAAAAGVVESQYNLGLLYQTGSGVSADASQARYWFRLAAARGDAEARRALAELKGPGETAQR